MKQVRLKTLVAAALSGLFISLLSVQIIPASFTFGIIAPPVPAFSTHTPLPAHKETKGPAKQVIVISIDGLRPDGITEARAANLLGLMQRGAYGTSAETIRPSITLPSHTAMLTGLDFKRHGVVWNNYRPGHIAHPTVFATASEAGLSTAMLFAKDKFHFLANPGQVHWIYGPGIPRVVPKLEDVTRPDFKENTGPDTSATRPTETTSTRPTTPAPKPDLAPKPSGPKPSTSADGIARAFAEEWPDEKYQLTFVHFGEPDGAGHAKGWMTRAYLDAVLKVDAAIGKILKTIDDAGETPTTAIIVSADHGGIGKQHYFRPLPDMAENVRIPWICAGPGVKPGTVISRPIRTMDTAPTALRFLGLPAPDGIDGAAVGEVFTGN